MVPKDLNDNFYDRIKPRLYRRVGRELHQANHVLDLGCGDCKLAGYLSETYGQKVTGVDISSDSFPDKKKISRDWPFVRCVRRSASRLDFIQNEVIDAIVMFWSLHEMDNPKVVLRQAHYVLNQAGKILVVEFPPDSLAQKLWNEKYYSKEELTACLRRAGFVDIQAKLLENKQILWVSGAARKRDTNRLERMKLKVHET
jgi:ubiquinone/menaquinone biosynthesis C-methylase UbiE